MISYGNPDQINALSRKVAELEAKLGHWHSTGIGNPAKCLDLLAILLSAPASKQQTNKAIQANHDESETRDWPQV